jgi:hypothetical protein
MDNNGSANLRTQTIKPLTCANAGFSVANVTDRARRPFLCLEL